MGKKQEEKKKRWLLVGSRLTSLPAITLLVLSVVIGFSLPVSTQTAAVGSFEIDGNLVDDPPGEPIDWSTDPAGNTPHPGLPNRVDFRDGSGQGDDIFGQGSKELEPGAWKCLTGSTPQKGDIVKGSIALRAIGQKRFMYVDFFRKGVDGDVHMDYEFNQSTEQNPACPALPKRTAGDVLITFDTEVGGKIILVRAFRWVGDERSGTFTELPLGSKGTTWDAAVNIPNTIPGAEAGAFGEAVINLTDSPIQLLCPETAYMKTRASSEINSELKDRTAPLKVKFGARPDLANASKSAFGVFISALGASNTLVNVSSNQHGVGSNRQEDRLATVTDPVTGGGIARAEVIVASSDSTITNAPAQATHTSISEVANLNLLNGAITADAVRGQATATASGSASSFSSVGSTFKNLKVAGVGVNDVAPGTRVDLPAAQFGAGSYVLLYERAGSTSTPAAGQIQGGTYAAELTVNMIHVFVTDFLPLVAGNQPVEVIVSNAVAQTDFPQTELCAIPPEQTVSGHAFVASAATDPSSVPTTVGFVSIAPNGGLDRQNLEKVDLSAGMSAGASQSESSGALTTDTSTASSFAQAAGVCLLPSATGCGISGTLVKSQSNSTAGASGTASSANGTELAGVVVQGTPVSVAPPPNTVIELPGIGFVVLNEQFCDNQGTLAANCSDGTVLRHAGLTVRAIRLVVTAPDNPLGLKTGQVIVAESHSDAAFKR
jgi:hypothetical protein